MKKYIIRLSRGIIIVLLPLVILLTLLQLYAFNNQFYLQEYVKYNVEEETKMTLEDLDKVTDRLIRYLRNQEDNLDIRVKVDGVETEVFGDREKQHMVDVKVLFQRGTMLRNGSLLIIPVLFLIVFLLSSNKGRNIWSTLLYSSIFPILLMAILFILVLIDFHKYFTYFHKIFFTNDLWLLNPKTDILIQMLPLGFFMDITIRVLSWFIFILVVMGGFAYYKIRQSS